MRLLRPPGPATYHGIRPAERYRRTSVVGSCTVY
jgi:hypothetical protein